MLTNIGLFYSYMPSTFIDKKFSRYKAHFILQPLIAAIFVVVMLAGLGGFTHVNVLGFIGTSTLGSSAFLVFSSPNSPSASMKRMWGGYIISIVIGALFSAVLYLLKVWHVDLSACFCAEIAAALAIAITMFLMALFGLEHPPAAGLALGLVVEPWTLFTLMVIMLTIVFMSLVKYLLRKWLIDLVKTD